MSTEDLHDNAHTRFTLVDDSGDNQPGEANGKMQLPIVSAGLLEGGLCGAHAKVHMASRSFTGSSDDVLLPFSSCSSAESLLTCS